MKFIKKILYFYVKGGNIILKKGNIEHESVIEKGDLNMAVLAKPSKKAFVVACEDKEKFENAKMPKSQWRRIRQISSKFDKNNLKMNTDNE